MDRVSAAIHSEADLEHLRRTDRLDEYRVAQVEIATLRAVRRGFKSARRKLNNLGPSQGGFGKFYERYVAAHGQPPPNDAGWTANRFGSRYRHPSHAMPHVQQRRGARLVKHWVTFRSMRPGVPIEIVRLATEKGGHWLSATAASEGSALLAGLVICPYCLSPMIMISTSSGRGRYRFYRCIRRVDGGPCPGMDMPAHPLERYVREWVVDVSDAIRRSQFGDPPRMTRRAPRYLPGKRSPAASSMNSLTTGINGLPRREANRSDVS